jgi:S1-C subfamily serine protease
MRWRLASIGVAVALAGASACSTERSDPTASAVTVEATGCRVFANRAVGMVVGEGLVATVAHAVAGEADVHVVTPAGRWLPARIVAIDTNLDAAVLRADGLDLHPIALRDYFAGEPVSLVRAAHAVVSSTPIEIRRRVTVRTTDIYRAGDHLRPGYQLAAPVEPGDSGGGIVGTDGRLLGLVWATSRQTDDSAWALPVEAIRPLITAARAGRPPAEAACAR